ncbi:uroporphyrinogen-III synthase [Variovorax sp. PAMC 28711]|uniref:uroporphyrinogen-III synthase n=1 Tax=Variovorax sp. PAMC 28711 TaxID=1795631 RepID=UPI00078E56CA|nr:uroporphyrinogen-III synthase [Variovorax sp. PAMC 28711]AMM25512.1 uroporphyrinogen III synthase [Variovorax sp. PAMC 28711]
MGGVRVIVTRPLREAQRWVNDLRAAGVDAVALPLIQIAPVDDVEPLRAAWRRIDAYAAVMSVSAAAVEEFFRHQRAEALQPLPRWWATGPGTARALGQAGVPAASIDTPAHDAGRFDSEALWAHVRAQVTPGARVLIVRGGDASGRPTGRDWLAQEVDAAGARRDTVVAYRRLAPGFAANEQAIAAEGASGRAIWLFSSSEAIANLQQAMPAANWHAARAVATHPRIAQAAADAGFGTVCLSQPLQASLVASIESLA